MLVLLGMNRSPYMTDPEVLARRLGEESKDELELFPKGRLRTLLPSTDFEGEDDGVLFMNGFSGKPDILTE